MDREGISPTKQRLPTVSSRARRALSRAPQMNTGAGYDELTKMTAEGHFRVPPPVNEPVRQYAPGDPNRTTLKARLAELTDARTEVPMQIGGERRWGASRGDIRSAPRHELAHA